MNISLILDTDDRRIEEPGYAKDCRPALEWDRMERDNVILEPFTRTVMLSPIYQPQPMTLAEWETSDDSFQEVGPSFFAGERCLLHTATFSSAWAQSTFALGKNFPFYLSLYLYLPRNPDLGQEVDIYFGGRYRLNLRKGEQAILYRASSDPPNWDTTVFDYSSYTWEPVVEGLLFPEGEPWHLRELKLAFLYIRRNRLLIVGNFGRAMEYTEDDVQQVPDSDTYQVAMEAPVRIEVSQGAWVAAWSPMTFPSSGWFESPAYDLPYESTEGAEVLYDWEVRPGTSCGLTFTKGDGSDPEPPMEDFKYRIDLTSDGLESPYFYRCQVDWPPTNEVVSGTNLNASADLVLAEEARSLDQPAQRLFVRLRDADGAYEAYAQRANTKVRLDAGGATRFVGYVDRPQRRLKGAEVVDFQVRDRWKRLQNTLLSDAEAFDGQEHPEVVKKIARLAGFDDSEMDVDDDDYGLPSAPEDAAALWQPENGQTAASFLAQIREEFSGWPLGVKADGTFYYKQPASGTVKRAFVTSTDFAGPEDLVVFTLDGAVDESQHRNEIWVIGQENNGDLLVACYIDHRSIKDPTYVYYVGERRPLILIDSSLNTESDVGWVCRTLADRFARFRQVTVWEGPFDPTLYPDDQVTVDGELLRLVSMDTTWSPGAVRTRYEGESA